MSSLILFYSFCHDVLRWFLARGGLTITQHLTGSDSDKTLREVLRHLSDILRYVWPPGCGHTQQQLWWSPQWAGWGDASAVKTPPGAWEKYSLRARNCVKHLSSHIQPVVSNKTQITMRNRYFVEIRVPNSTQSEVKSISAISQHRKLETMALTSGFIKICAR